MQHQLNLQSPAPPSVRAEVAGTPKHARGMLEAVVNSSVSCIDDVAHWGITLAKLSGNDATVDVTYKEVVLHIRGEDTIESVSVRFHDGCRLLRATASQR